VLQSHRVDDDPLLAPTEPSSVSTVVDFSNSRQQQIETTQSSRIYNDNSEYNLRAIPGSAAYSQTQDQKESNRKRLKTSSGSSNSLPPPTLLPSLQPIGTVAESTRPVNLVDPQETGVQLVHTLLACAEAVKEDNLKLADAPVKHVHGRGGKTRRGLWKCEG
jgi:DELLA protein